MSDFTTDPYGDDEATMELIYQMLSGGWTPYGQQMNVPYQKDVTGSSTDPSRAFKSQDTILKSQASLMGFSPIQEFAGPEPTLWVPGTEQLAEEIAGDEFGQQLIERLDSGEGIINLQKQIVNATYDPELDLGPTEDKPMAPQEAEVYLDWLKRYSKARSEDYIKLSQPGAVTDPAETDVMADLPTDAALNFNENDFINKLRVGGVFGEERKNLGAVGNRPETLRRTFGADQPKRGMVARPPGQAAPVMGPQKATRNRYTDILDRGRDQLEQKYRGDARQAQATSRRPSLAKERAFRAIVAYRLAHGMNPT